MPKTAKQGLKFSQKDRITISGSGQQETESSIPLIQILSLKNILTLKSKFENAPGKVLTKSAFQRALYDIAKIKFSTDVFNQLCLKMNYSRTEKVTEIGWENFLIFLKMEFETSDETKLGKLELPIVGNVKTVRSYHRLPIIRMAFLPEILHTGEVNNLYGAYITLSRDGQINYWNIDMELERKVAMKIKSQTTWVTDLAAFPDLNIICTGSTEKDLRFYDTTAKKFDLRLQIIKAEDFVTALYYSYSMDKNIPESKLVIGYSSGKVKMVYITTKNRGPFQCRAREPLRVFYFDQFLKGGIEGMRPVCIPAQHTDWILQVGYSKYLNSVISVSNCSVQSMYVWSPSINDESSYSFAVSKGFSCFACSETSHLIATGGSDWMIRLWNPFMTSRCLNMFRGHHSSIVSLILQDENVLISLDLDKCVKVWDIVEQNCIQSFFGLSSPFVKGTSLCTLYNPASRQVFVANYKINSFQVYPPLNAEYTDGVTHSKEVSVVLFNSLFSIVITCGFDSFIILWNPWTGKMLKLVRDAHITEYFGETVPVEITAATLDPSEQFLITGASNGTLKIWMISLMHCVRNMSINTQNEILSIIWIKYRILVMGENRMILEFFDGDEVGSSSCKSWAKKHVDDILCSCVHLPSVLVTGSYSGELVFWRLETGQSFGIYNVAHPMNKIALYLKDKKPIDIKTSKADVKKTFYRKKFTSKYKVDTNFKSASQVKIRSVRNTVCNVRISINVLLALTARPIHSEIGGLVAALDNGYIQIWSLHTVGGFITEFRASHTYNDYVISLTTDKANQYLYTGHMTGYIKTWHLVNYCILEEYKVHICMPKIRLMFPFLWEDLFVCRAKRAHRSNNNKPLLLNSYKAHKKAVTGLKFIDGVDILFSSSSDCTTRIWTMNGKYMGTLGTFKKWTNISSKFKPPDDVRYSIPADLKRCASFTTLKVLTGGEHSIFKFKKEEKKQFQLVDPSRIYGKRVDLDSVLGKHFKIIPNRTEYHPIVMNINDKNGPIYNQLVLYPPEEIKQIPTPERVHEIEAQLKIMAENKENFKKNTKKTFFVGSFSKDTEKNMARRKTTKKDIMDDFNPRTSGPKNIKLKTEQIRGSG